MKKTLLLFVTSLFFVFSVQAQDFVGKWKLSSIKIGKDKTVISSPVTLNLGEENRIGGNGGCNTFGGEYLIENANEIKFDKIFSTKMYCDATSKTEDVFFQSLQSANKISVKKDKLIITNKEKKIRLVFEKVAD